MIGWLEGLVLERWQERSRLGLVLVCGGVGYELQVSRCLWHHLPANGKPLQLYVHTLARDEGWQLVGFAERRERDLFRILIGVSGIGLQAAMALQGELEVDALINAIVTGDLRRLCQAPGVGKRTAERLCVELRETVSRRFELLASTLPPCGEAATGAPPVREEVRETLHALGYDTLEIHRALHSIEALPHLQAEADGNAWVREALRALSRPAA